MRKNTISKLAILLILLALDWAALHDIVKAEPDLTPEYAAVAISIVMFIGLLIFSPKRKRVHK